MLRMQQAIRNVFKMTCAPPKNPLIAIVGSTGTGKSELAVEIARRYGGEIINGDAMQLYAGLPIITNKITVPEQKGVPHHLLGCIGLEEQTWVVGTFVRRALRTIGEIRSRGNIPILVGGTHYYTQSLLFHDRLAAQEDDNLENEVLENNADRLPILQEPTEVVLEELRKVDPVMADRWHPNDRRKIQRSLEIFLKTGRKASEIYAEQRERSEVQGSTEDTLSSGEMRFPTIIFWVHSESSALQQRLNSRVDKMLSNGLLDEVQALDAFALSQTAAGRPVDETRGIWVSIGYKEFKPYTSALRTSSSPHASPPSDGNSPPSPPPSPSTLETLKLFALERTKISTRQYAKSQARWLRIKFSSALASAGAIERMFVLDASGNSSSSSSSSSSETPFTTSVIQPALSLTNKFLRGEPLPAPSSLSTFAAEALSSPGGRRGYDLSSAPEKWSRKVCEVCGTTCVTEDAWAAHARSRAHKKLSAAAKRKGGEGKGKEEEEEGRRKREVEGEGG